MAGREVPNVSVVVPVFRSARTIEQLCGRIGAVLSDRKGGYELILVEDGAVTKRGRPLPE